MKLNGIFSFIMLCALVCIIGVKQVDAQESDTLIVEYTDGAGDFVEDALRIAIENDTDRPEGRVYKLRAGGYYWITETITNDGWPLRIVGEEPDPNDATKAPAVVQRVSREDGSVTERLITGAGDITLKNLYIIGCDDAGIQGAYQPIQMDASNSRFVIDNCILERTNFALIAWTAKNNDIFITNCVYRNLIETPAEQVWAGRGISIWADQDTVIIENNTFFNIGFTALQVESGAANYLRFNHNTLVNIGRGLNATPWLTEAYFANNLFVNVFWQGEAHNQNELDSPNRDPRATTSGIFGFGTLPSVYGPEAGRRILFTNNSAWLDPEFTSFYDDSIRAQPFVNPVLEEDFITPYEQIIVRDTTWLSARPDFPTYPSEIIDDMIANVNGIRAGGGSIPTYFWELPMTDGTICNVCPSWPLPEDFSYTTGSLMTAATDGLPLGDLNWFPTQKADFEANKDDYVSQMESLAGDEYEYNIVDEAEAEDGTLGGTAEVLVAEGQKYFQMSGGYIKWEFELEETAQYDINVMVDLNNRATSGVNFFVNDFEIHDTRGWGQYVFGIDESSVHPDFPANGLDWWLVTETDLAESADQPLHLPAGKNVVEIKANWCDNAFGGLQIIKAGTSDIVLELGAEDVTDYSIATPGIVGAPWTPQGFKSVSMGSDGNVTVSLTAANSGDYVIQAGYQNYSSASTGNIMVDGATAGTFSYSSEDDSTGIANLSPEFALTAGAHQITLSGSDVRVDYVQLIEKSVVTGIRENDELAKGFALEQNYPNPFNPTTNIKFSLGKHSNVKLTVYNILGQRVVTLINKEMSAGSYTFNFDAGHLASGVYIYQLETADFRLAKKMMLLK